MNLKSMIKVSKFMSYAYALRHKPADAGIVLGDQGWVSLEDIIVAINKNGFSVSLHDIHKIVESNDKKRFALSDNGKFIRASQGHSFKGVNIQYHDVEPPEFLFHGTATRFKKSIFEKGLIAGERHHVHLSQNLETAISVGRRHGEPIVLKVDAKKMHQSGFKFYLSDNDVYLVDFVPFHFLSIF